MRSSLVTTALLLALTTMTTAQSFNFPDFSNVSNLMLNVDAAQAGTSLRVSSAALSKRGTAFFNQPVSVANGFETTFDFQITSPNAGGGDGMCFIIHNDPRGSVAIGNHASALGYGAFPTSPAGTAIANSLVIEIDTYFSGNNNDSSSNEISVHTGGTGDTTQDEALSIGRVSPTPNMSSGVHTMRIRHQGGMLDIFLDNLTTAVLSVPYDFNTGGTYTLPPNNTVGGLNLAQGEFAWVGFGGSSGAAWENHDILNWDWNSPLLGACWAGNVGGSFGGPFNVLGIDGGAGGAAREVHVALGTTFFFTMDQPSTSAAPSNFYLTTFAGFAPANAPFAMPAGLGDFCYQIPFPASTPPNAFVLAETFGLGTGILPAAPTPWSFPVFGGLPFPLQFTMQAVIEESPGVLKTTNAVRVSIP
ncbi:MAG: hypothetical protein KDB53_17490 [Planctomycetes bacterium]|nr:hypothetical protein [Planctomycetota bacterium]